MWPNWETLFPQQNVSEFVGDIFASWEANIVSATMFREVNKQENIDKKHVSTTIFPEVDKLRKIDRKH